LTSSLTNKLATDPSFEHASGIPLDSKMISALVTPPPEEEKQDSKA
jgi:hypothetical protein